MRRLGGKIWETVKNLNSGMSRPDMQGGTLMRKGSWYIIALALVLVPQMALAQGLNIPLGSTINVNTGTLNVIGQIDINGTVQTTSGTIGATGDWDNATGTYTAGTGTVNLNGSSGTQNLVTGGIGAGNLFFNLSHTAASTVLVDATNNVNIDGAYNQTAGDFNTNGKDITVAGNWNNSSAVSPNFIHGSATVTLDGTNQSVTGSTSSFYNFTKNTGAHTLTFGAGSTQEVVSGGTLTLLGTADAGGSRLTMNSDSPPTTFVLNLLAGGLQNIQFIDLSNSEANSLNLVARDSLNSGGNDDAAAAPHWIFGGATLTWDGDIDSDWDTAANWDLGFVPNSSDSVIIPDTSAGSNNYPDLSTLAAAGVTVVDMDITSSVATLTLNGKNLTVTTTLDSEGTITLDGNETVTIAAETCDADTGTWVFEGDGGGAGTVTVPNVASQPYCNLQINDSTDGDEFEFTNDIIVTRDLTITAGTLDADNDGIDVGGDVLINGGTLIAPGSAETFTVADDWTLSSGTFTNNSGTVTLDGANQTIAGNNTFNGLTNTFASGQIITFTFGDEQIVSSNLDLQGGGAGDLLTINSDVGGSQARLTLTSGVNATQILDFLSVQDNDASNGLLLVARNSTEAVASSTTNWVFGGTTMTWEGDVTGDLTNWDNAANWDLGVVPTDADTANIPNVTNDPTLESNVNVENLTIAVSTTVTLAGFNMIIDSTLSNEGTVTLQGGETVTITTPDTDSGTFNYIGTGASATLTISDISAAGTDYYNVIFNDPSGATPDTFQTSGNITVANNINVTGGTLDISTGADTLTVTADLTVDGGTLTATAGNIDVNDDVILSSGTLTAPGASLSFTIADDFDRSGGGTFTHSSGEVTFDSAATSTLLGSTTFFDFTSSTAGKTIEFTDGTTQTVAGTIDITGASGNEIVLNSTGGGTWFLDLSVAGQTVGLVNVFNSDALSNDITCFNCGNGGGNDNLAASPHWVFSQLIITVPESNKTIDTTTTILGIASSGVSVDIWDSSNTVVATATADSNGNFRVEVAVADALTVGAGETLRPVIAGPIIGTAVLNLTVSASPTTAQVPTITSHSDGDRISGALPTISGLGAASGSATAVGLDANGDLVLSAGTATADGAGNYSLTFTTAMPKGDNTISITVEGVATDLLTVKFTDPFGVVFDSASNNLINQATVTLVRVVDDQPAVVGVDLDAGDVNPVTTGTDGFFSFIATDADYYMTVAAEGYIYPSTLSTFPVGRTIVSGSKGETFTITSVVIEMDQPVDAGGTLMRIEKDANKSEVRVGEIVTYTVKMESRATINNLVDVRLRDNIPPGFKYLKDRVTLDGVPISNPAGNRPVFFSVGTFTPGQSKELKYQLVVGSGVTAGAYNNTATAVNSAELELSNHSTETVDVVLDPLFDLGTVIGKVFFDRNENGIQDDPEYVFMDRETLTEDPVPSVKIVMEDGTVITTDANGRFSVPAITPGRHLFRIDERSLPDDSYLTTEKVVVVNITEGLLVKVNFGVNFDNDRVLSEDQQFFISKVKVTQEKDKAKPRLNVDLFADKVVVYNGTFVDQQEFRIFTNYVPFIEAWKLEIIDRDTNKKIKTFWGNRHNIHDPIFWDGRDNTGEYIRSDKNYAYRLVVEDKDGNFDETKEKDITLRILENESDIEEEIEEVYKEYIQQKEIDPREYLRWLNEESEKNNLNIQTILVEGETVSIDRIGARLQSVRIRKAGELVADIPVTERMGLTAKELLEGKVQDIEFAKMEVILPEGDYDIVIQEEGAVDAAIEVVEGVEVYQGTTQAVGVPVKSYVKPIKVGEDYLFFVAMGDVEAGYTFTGGNIEPITPDDKFNKGFWSEGKLAYYVKGKILGKYLVTSSFDSDRERKELFRNLDPDTYYPVYGDSSSIDYQSTDTQGPLYLLIEWDKSSVIWGNYSVGFDDTEFAKFSRTLYGGKIDFESISNTKYGDARSQVVLFRAKANQKGAHVEFLATGGSLYFLKHKAITEGSEKVFIEVRDKITGLVISSREMKEGADFEMDYPSGRMIFWRPVPVLVDTLSIISSELLDGNLAYVVVDYEYEPKDDFDQANVGARVRQAVTDQVLVGGTYVKENLEASDYQLLGTDITIRLGPDATVVAEYAETESESTGTFVSTDGGLSFTEIGTNEFAEGRAYGIKGDAKLFNRLAIESYYKWIENDFSSTATSAQQGKELIGFGTTFDITDATRVTLRHDIQSLIDDGTLQTQFQLGAVRTATTLAQIVHESRKLKLTGEYQHQVVTERIDQFDTQANREENVLALRGDYELVNDYIKLSLEQQYTVSGDQVDYGHQTTMGITIKPTDKITLTAEEVIGQDGTATQFEVTADLNERLDLTGAYAIATDSLGVVTSTTTVGATGKVSDKIQLQTSIGMAETTGGNKTTTVTMGGTADVNDKTKLETTIGIAQSSQGAGTTTLTLGGTSQIDDDTNIRSEFGLTGTGENQTTTIAFGGTSRINDKTRSSGEVSLSETTADGKTTSYTFGTTTKLSDQLELASTRSFGSSPTGSSKDDTYSLIRNKDGRKLEGSLARAYSEDNVEITRSNIYGLSGDINDRWALTGLFESGEVQNIDGTQTDRSVFSLGAGYVKTNAETGESLKSSTKIEMRTDEGDVDRRQYLVYNTIEGKITPEVSLFTKFEMSRTRNLTDNFTEADHREIVIGGAYRPISHDRLNLLSRYTYQDNLSPAGQEDTADVQELKKQVLSAEAIYDLSEKWQVSEKFAYRILEEKVSGFDFSKTHTWLMIHRLNYKINKDWTFGGEFRMLTQEEAEDVRRGFLIEVARRMGDYAQLGMGINFTDFTDDLTDLDYTAGGPFVRLTGKFYDRTPAEVERAREKWLNERIDRWAWMLVNEELAYYDSPILEELNTYFALADRAKERGDYKESKQIYRDIVMAAEMMLEEAAEYIRSHIEKEEQLQDMKSLADQYFKNHEYEKAKKILEKILEDAQEDMLE